MLPRRGIEGHCMCASPLCEAPRSPAGGFEDHWIMKNGNALPGRPRTVGPAFDHHEPHFRVPIRPSAGIRRADYSCCLSGLRPRQVACSAGKLVKTRGEELVQRLNSNLGGPFYSQGFVGRAKPGPEKFFERLFVIPDFNHSEAALASTLCSAPNAIRLRPNAFCASYRSVGQCDAAGDE